MAFALKLLAPEALASAVIGKGGAVIASMRQSTQAKISLTEHSDLYPGTDCRVLSVQANSEESLAEVTTRIIAKLAECVQGNSSTSDQLGQPGELKLRALAPRAAVGGLIGKGGAAIKQLRESTHAKISVSEAAGSGPSADQMVITIGTQEALEQVMVQVNRNVSALNKEAWFAGWAATLGTASRGNGAGQSAGQGYGGLAAPTYSGGAGGGVPYASAGAPSASMDLMQRVALGLPPSVMQDSRGFALSCVVPNRLVGGLIGRGGSGTKEVQAMTNTQIGIREIPGDAENRQMNIAGPLPGTCAAYMLMMKRYLDAEAQAAAGETARGGGGRRGAAAQPQAPVAS